MRLVLSAALLMALCPASGLTAEEVPSFRQWRAQKVPADYPSCADYLRVLSRWPHYAETDWHAIEADATMARYGPGDSAWGMMCHASAMFCYALLATDPGYVPWNGGPDREALLRRVNQGLRLMTRCHVTGDLDCTDGKRWSDASTQWHSATWAENMGAAADLAWQQLTPGNREAVRRVLTWEAERLSAEEIPSGDFADTQAESNAWDASVLARAAVMFPDDERAGKWRERAIEWAMNTLSVPQDAQDTTLIDGQPVNEWVHTVNVHRSFAGENHGFYHVCYMWWPMWCLASAHYGFAGHGQPTPPSLYHHWTDLFSVLKRCYLTDGRFAYVGGKDWPRYVYGLTAAVPAYIVLADELGEPSARMMEREAFRRYEWEQLYDGDGSFLGRRFADLKQSGPRGYQAYCRYEADEAIMLGLAYKLHQLKSAPPPMPAKSFTEALRGGFECPDAEIAFRRDDDRFVSWAWKTHTRRPQGIVAVPDDSTLPEWDYNLCGSFETEGTGKGLAISRHAQGLLQGGLWSAGTVEWGQAPPPPGTAPRFLQVVDDNVPVKAIVTPDHPIFDTPNRIDSLAGLVDLDSITAASPEWTVLAENARGGPSILETQVGRGRILVCMNSADSDYTEGKPGGRLFENLMAYAKSHATRPIGYLPRQNSARKALDQYGLAVEPVGPLASSDLSRFDVILMDRGSSPDVQANAWRLVRFAEQGGLLIRFCLQDTEWQEDQLSGVLRPGAITHHLGCLALPDGRTTVVCELALANRGVTLRAVRGLNWNLGNDLFNGNRRTLYTETGTQTVEGVGGESRETELAGRWVNVDDTIGLAVLGPPTLALTDRAERSAPYKSYCYETVFLQDPAIAKTGAPRQCEAGDTVLSDVCVFYTRTSRRVTERLSRDVMRLDTSVGNTTAVRVPTPNGRQYLVAWNFNEETEQVPLRLSANVGQVTVPGVSARGWEIVRGNGGGLVLRELR